MQKIILTKYLCKHFTIEMNLMEKLDELRKLKSLFDEGVLTEDEFLSMKNEILSQQTKNEIHDLIKEETTVNKKGILNICFGGQWFLFDCTTKLFINDELHSSHSTKEGFDVDIPINSDTMTVKLVLAGMRSTTYEIEELNSSKHYTMELIYSSTWGRYSNEFKLTENG